VCKSSIGTEERSGSCFVSELAGQRWASECWPRPGGPGISVSQYFPGVRGHAAPRPATILGLFYDAMSLRERTRPGLGIIEPDLPSPFRQVFCIPRTVTLHLRTHPRGHIKPCLPLPAERPPSGPDWLHEIKHDGFRIVARRDANGVRLYTRNGYNFAGRFPQIVEAVSKLKVRSCLIDGEAIVVDKRGLSAFDLLRSWRHDHAAVLCAFDLLELPSNGLRREPIDERKRLLESCCAARL